ncbi:ceramide synthase 5 [Tetranychus urticae]|uniref:Homeobox domain-containing protein n=1 Tax=Tetranychus urticae TaxID=32264 RepID=T1KA74_TETUR|nr:ceramide synthase 5 [Tetranychus urticae]
MASARDLFIRISDAFWSESIWLPPNTTWKIYEDRAGGINYAQFNDIYYSLLTAIVILCIRITFERLIFRPLGQALGISDRPRVKLEKNEVLEKAFRINRRPSPSTIQALSKRTDLSTKAVESWFNRRQAAVKPTTLARFTESSWKCTFYTFSFFFGVWALWDKPWTWDSMHCFIDYPHHSVSSEIWWYYNIELGFYISLIISQFFDVKYSDFWQMFIHHVVTVLLLCFSWACNLHRIGTLVLIIHDFADIPLEGTKITRYMKTPRLANVVFSVFLICWIYSRLGLLPTRVIAYSTYYALSILPMFPAYYIFNGLLCTLQVLHIVWTWLILKIAHNAIFVDGVKDLRESDDEDDD